MTHFPGPPVVFGCPDLVVEGKFQHSKPLPQERNPSVYDIAYLPSEASAWSYPPCQRWGLEALETTRGMSTEGVAQAEGSPHWGSSDFCPGTSVFSEGLGTCPTIVPSCLALVLSGSLSVIPCH